MLYQRLTATGATAYIDMMPEIGKRILHQHRKYASSSTSLGDRVHTWAFSASITFVAGVAGENQTVGRDSRTTTSATNTSPRTNDTNVDARRVVMGLQVSCSISFSDAYA
jgi:hypothetical protein